jgi:hypothetical protein
MQNLLQSPSCERDRSAQHFSAKAGCTRGVQVGGVRSSQRSTLPIETMKSPEVIGKLFCHGRRRWLSPEIRQLRLGPIPHNTPKFQSGMPTFRY